MVVVNGVSEDRVALLVADRLRAALRDPFYMGHQRTGDHGQYGNQQSIPGTAPMSARCGRNADAAMYEAKTGRQGFACTFYTPALGAALPGAPGNGNRPKARARQSPAFVCCTNPCSPRPKNGKRPTKLYAGGRIRAAGLWPPNEFIPAGRGDRVDRPAGRLGAGKRRCRQLPLVAGPRKTFGTRRGECLILAVLPARTSSTTVLGSGWRTLA